MKNQQRSFLKNSHGIITLYVLTAKSQIQRLGFPEMVIDAKVVGKILVLGIILFLKTHDCRYTSGFIRCI